MSPRCLPALTVALFSLTVGCRGCDRPRVHAELPGTTDGGHATSPSGGVGLVASSDGRTIYDPSQRVYWLADANLAGDPSVRAAMGVRRINPNGTMTYAAALEWVKALNAYDHGAGYLGHHDWQLPTTPTEDASCAIPSGRSGNSFGSSCTGSALGKLYRVGFGAQSPNGIVPPARNRIGPFQNLQQGLYWTSGKTPDDQPTEEGSPNAFTYTFSSSARGRNTTAGNYFYVLPMVRGAIGHQAPRGQGLVAYTSGPAAGLAVYDGRTGTSWALDADLAASNRFGLGGTTRVSFGNRAATMTVPTIATSGTMLFATALDWVRAMNQAGYAGSREWILPTVGELQTLYEDLGLATGYEELLAHGRPDPFQNLQLFFYWACQRGDGDSRSPCTEAGPGVAPDGHTRMQWAFNFQSGFQGTDEESKEFFVMVYYPAPG